MAVDHFLNLQPGTIVNGRYEVVKCLGTGSMGMVYACRHRELAGRIVAMKVLFPEVARDEVAAARFRNEIVACYEVSHPNVVRAYEYFRDGDLIAFTMEYIPGGDIADKIANSDEIAIDEVLRMLSQMCSGVQAIHEAGIIHRDLKPENILLTAQGDVKITDFGIARAGTGPRLTDHGGVVGTIDYVSPEYLERAEVDARSDIYALGVIAYEMITHEAPFKGKSVIETMTLRLRTDPEPPHNLRKACPEALSDIVLKAMARDPLNRYQSAREMYEDLQTLIREGKIALRPRPAASAAAQNGAKSHVGKSIAELAMGGSSQPTYVQSGSVVQAHGGQEMVVEKPHTAPSSSSSKHAALYEGFDDDAEGLNGQLESVLSGNRPAIRDYRPADEFAVHPSVAISQSHLSSERLKALASDFHRPGNYGGSSWLGSFLLSLVVFFFGFGVGWILLKHFKPELFDSPPSAQSAPSAEQLVQ